MQNITNDLDEENKLIVMDWSSLTFRQKFKLFDINNDVIFTSET